MRLALVLCVGLLAAAVPAARAASPILLTGDSTMYVMAPVVANALAPQETKHESWPGTGITKTFVFGWVKMSRLQAFTLAPRATVVSIGAGDIYPLPVRGRLVGCCSKTWQRAYA